MGEGLLLHQAMADKLVLCNGALSMAMADLL